MTKQTVEKKIYKKAYHLKIDTLEREIDKIESKELMELGKKFYENMNTVSMMVSLPVILCTDDFMGFNHVLLIVEARIASKTINWGKASEEDKTRYLEEEKRIWETKYKPQGKQLVDEAMNKAEDKFSSILKRPDIYKSYRSLLYSGIVFIWCSYEIFMKDLWETSLNIAGKRVKKMALENIGKIDNTSNYSGIRGKYISIDYLGQYNYDIRNKLGSILVNKFDFTSPYGIKNAYQCAFPKSLAIKEAIENEGLVQLEARRSVIVHKAGIIDTDFCKKIGVNQKEIGTNLEISDEEVFNYGNITIDSVLKVTEAVSYILSGGKV